MIEVIMAVGALAYCSFQLGINHHQRRVTPELIKARQDNDKYRMLLKDEAAPRLRCMWEWPACRRGCRISAD